MWPLRTAVSGKQNTPGGATELMEVLGKMSLLEESVLESRNFSKDSEKRYNGI